MVNDLMYIMFAIIVWVGGEICPASFRFAVPYLIGLGQLIHNFRKIHNSAFATENYCVSTGRIISSFKVQKVEDGRTPQYTDADGGLITARCHKIVRLDEPAISFLLFNNSNG